VRQREESELNSEQNGARTGSAYQYARRRFLADSPEENYEAGAAGALVFGEAVFVAGLLFFGCAVLVATVLTEVDFAAFLDFAQRAFCAAAIFARASGLKVRTAFTFARSFVGSSLVSLGRPATPAGRPGFLLTVVPGLAKSAFACCNRKISASILTTISFVFNVSSTIENKLGADCCILAIRDRTP
jgi:hypothetical protein